MSQSTDAGRRVAAQLRDALIASLSAQAAARRLVDPVPEDMLAEARVEGWIMLPDRDALQRLLPR